MHQIEITPSFEHALKVIRSGESNVFVTGKAGTGKSTLLKHLCDSESDAPVVIAPTGVAAINVGGQTIHRFFRFPTTVTPEAIRNGHIRASKSKVYRNLRRLIIDEVSMVRADLLDCIDIFLKLYGPMPGFAFGGVQMVYFGDLYQLPPVVMRDERAAFSSFYDSPYFFSSHAIRNVKLNIIELDKVFRQEDQRFINILNSVRNGTIGSSGIAALNRQVIPHFTVPARDFYVTLTTMNEPANRINLDRLAAIPERKLKSRAEVEGEFTKDYFPAPQVLEYKTGAQIMLLNNDSSGRWVNGSIGIIVNSGKEGADPSVMVRLHHSGETVEVERHEWGLSRLEASGGKLVPVQIGTFRQLPFRLAWAVTIHKSQGKTFDRMVIDLGRVFSPGQTYVALSRCTTLESIVLKRPIKPSDIRVDRRVHRFLSGGQRELAERANSPARRRAIIQSAIDDGAHLRIEYLSGSDSESTRIVKPHAVAIESYKGTSFEGVQAYCMLRKDDRTFRLDRILSVERLET